MSHYPSIAKPNSELLSPRARFYIDQALGSHLAEAYRLVEVATKSLLSGLSEAQASYRYEAKKWSVKELLLHITDCERLQSCRALWLAREPGAAIPGFDENIFASHSRADSRSLADLLAEYDSVRAGTLSLLQSISDDDLDTLGRVDGLVASARSVLWMSPGHESHHLKVLKDRYGLTQG